MINNETTNTPFFTIRREGVICLILAIAILAVYWQVQHYDFVNFDDDKYVTENLNIQAGITLKSVKWAFTNFDQMYWHPLTWLSHMLDCELYGLEPGMHHLTSLLFHIVNTLLLFLVFRKMTGSLWQSAFVAALFALHPINVDTVAWVAERKNVLSTFLWILTMFTYARYIEKPGLFRYMLTFSVFALGLMAKPMLVTLPFVLLLLDYWPLRRLRFGQSNSDNRRKARKPTTSDYTESSVFRLVLEKTPFFLLVILYFCLISLSFQPDAIGVVSTESVSMNLRLANALVSCVSYMGKMIWPQDLAVLYPFPTTMLPMWQITGAGLLLVCVSVLVARAWKQKPYFVVGWLWFLGTLVPVIGIIQGGLWPAMADRWAYVPLIGIFIMIAWGVPDLLSGWQHRRAFLAISSGCILSVLTMVTWMQLQYWQNSTTLFKHAISVTENNAHSHINLGVALQEQRKTDEAIAHYTEALKINPDYAKAHYNLGIALQKQGKVDEAIAHYTEALKIEPDSAKAHYTLGVTLAEQGKLAEAIDYLTRALKIKPDYAEAHYNLGVVLAEQGKIAEAIDYFTKALKIKPDYVEAYCNLGNALVTQGRVDEAISHYSEALRINPDDDEVRANLQLVLTVLKETDKDIQRLKELLEINPGDPELHYGLGNQYYKRRDFEKSIYQYQKTLSINPDAVPVLNNLAIVYMAKRDYEKAVSVFGRIADFQPDNASVYYNIACIYSIQNKTRESMDSLKMAIEKGYDNWEHIRTDKDLKNIRNSIYYKNLMSNHRGGLGKLDRCISGKVAL